MHNGLAMFHFAPILFELLFLVVSTMLRTQFDKSWHQSTQGTGKGHNKQSLGQAETTTLEKWETHWKN